MIWNDNYEKYALLWKLLYHVTPAVHPRICYHESGLSINNNRIPENRAGWSKFAKLFAFTPYFEMGMCIPVEAHAYTSVSNWSWDKRFQHNDANLWNDKPICDI